MYHSLTACLVQLMWLSGFICIVSYIFIFFFFFQAEDGIRDLTVTGVQTCALPISVDSCRLNGLCICFRFAVAHSQYIEIGRASCRESVDLGGRRIIKKKKKKKRRKG